MRSYSKNGRPVNGGGDQDTSSRMPGEAPEPHQARQRLLANGFGPITDQQCRSMVGCHCTKPNDPRFIQRVSLAWLIVDHGEQGRIFLAFFLGLFILGTTLASGTRLVSLLPEVHVKVDISLRCSVR